jgi:type IV secretory pathway VirJ component
MTGRTTARPAALLALLVLCAGTAAAPPPAAAPARTGALPSLAVEHLSFGRFGQVSLYRNTANPRSVAVFLSGDQGWGADEETMARGLAALDALVIGVDAPYYTRRLQRGDDACVYPAGDLENLAKLVEKKLEQPRYTRPAVIGLGSNSAAFAYGSLGQAPAGTFLGAVSLGFCPTVELERPFCELAGAGSKGAHPLNRLPAVTALEQPWIAVVAGSGNPCATAAQSFVPRVKGASLVSLPAPRRGATSALRWMAPLKQSLLRLRNTDDLARPPQSVAMRELADLPVLEIPAAGIGDTLAVVVSGDGGWTGLDRQVANVLASRGMPVAALNTLDYFWNPRTPDGAGADLARIVRTYLQAAKRQRVVLIGYSLGAEVLPFMAARLPADVMDKVRLLVLLGPGRSTSFEFRLSEMQGHGGGQDLPVLPELAKLGGKPVLCLYGDAEKQSSLCTQQGAAVKAVNLAGGHYLGGDPRAVADQLLGEMQPSKAALQAAAGADVVRGATAVVPAPRAAPPAGDGGKLTTDPFDYGRFGRVTLYRRSAQPQRLAILLSGSEGWTGREKAMATEISALDTLVVGVDIRRYERRLAGGDECAYLAGSLELLSRAVQKRLHFPAYRRPILIGAADGAALAYAALAQAPPNTFSGALSLGFCPELTLPVPLCGQQRLETKPLDSGRFRLLPSASIEQPWITLSGERDTVCPASGALGVVRSVAHAQAFALPGVDHEFGKPAVWADALRGSVQQLFASPRAPGEVEGSAELPGIPVIEMQPKTASGEELAVIYSGDGGWAGADRDLAKVLAGERGIPVVGVDLLRYLWEGKTPEAAAADLAKILRHYTTGWRRKKAVLVGYSLGADVLPFLISRLPAELRSQVELLVLLGPSPSASFEIRVTEDKTTQLPVLPELNKLRGLAVLCVSGEGESDSLCPALDPHTQRLNLPGSHGFAAQSGVLADRILTAARAAASLPSAVP